MKIQKVFRGHSVRRTFIDTRLNDFVAEKDPASYTLEKLMYEVTQVCT
jgi:hypothetical protein